MFGLSCGKNRQQSENPSNKKIIIGDNIGEVKLSKMKLNNSALNNIIITNTNNLDKYKKTNY